LLLPLVSVKVYLLSSYLTLPNFNQAPLVETTSNLRIKGFRETCGLDTPRHLRPWQVYAPLRAIGATGPTNIFGWICY